MAAVQYLTLVKVRTFTVVFAALISLLLSVAIAPGAPGEKIIHLRNQTITTKDNSNQGQPSDLERGINSHLRLIQFEGPIEAEWREVLTRLGVKLLVYIPEDTFVADVGGTPPGSLQRLEFVRWLGLYKPEYKVDGRLKSAAAVLAGRDETLEVSILLARGADTVNVAQVKGKMVESGQESRLSQGTILRGRIPASELGSLADSDAVLWIETAPRMRLLDEEAAKIVGGDDGLRSTPTITQQLGYDGSGVVVAVADTGLDSGNASSMHPDLAGRVDDILYYGSLTDGSDHHSHGTHVSGIIAGNAATGESDGNGALFGLGVASGAHIVSQRIFDGEGGYRYPNTSFEPLTRDAVSAGATIGNNSWGEDNQGRYDLTAMEFDSLVRDADSTTPGDQQYILEFSAGNAGPVAQSVGTPGIAKNVITSGACQNNRFDFFLYTEGQEAMANFSSKGPCEDGRIKPDVVAPGTWIASLRSVFANDDNAWAPISPKYMYQGGTSQAGPQISGAAAVLVQFYRATHAGDTPSPALVKAMLINCSVDMDDDYGTAAIPNNSEGWGRVDLTRVFDSQRTTVLVDQTNLLVTSASYETTIVVEDYSEPLKVTLAYTDVPGFAGGISALVNDLDLEVISPDGTLYKGNRFYNGDSIPNATLTDKINNVEAVHLLTPQPGEYHVRVFANNVAEDSRIDTGAVDQDFALAISGLLLPANKSVIYMNKTAYTAPNEIQVGVIDRDQAGQSSLAATISSDTESGGESLTLLAAGGGVFTNTILTATGPASIDGELQIAHGDIITATYFDTSAGVLRSAPAVADLLPPEIADVGSTNRFGQADVFWITDEPATSRVEYGTNGILSLATSIPGLSTNHVLKLENLVSGVTNNYRVISTDTAGNSATNDNGGSLFTLVAPDSPPVLLVDAYYEGTFDYLVFPPPPLSNYTAPLTQLGIPFEIWDHASQGSPSLETLSSYRVVIWRLPELNFVGYDPYPTFTPLEQATIAEYLNQGGGFFVASMEVMTRLAEVGAEAFRSDVLKVGVFDEVADQDATVPSVSGIADDPITDGMSLVLDYLEYWYNDLSDTFTPSATAAGIFTEDASGKFAGLRYPGPGVESPGRLVFLSFPFDAIPATGLNNRSDVLRRILQFLSPGITGEAVLSTDRSAYSLPAIIAVELGDVDLEGAGSITLTASSTTEPAGKAFVLEETTRPGLFRGQIPLLHATNSPATNQLRAVEGDTLTFRYFDSSIPGNVETTAIVDVTPPIISGVSSTPGYSTATIIWDTDEPCDSLVQYGESLPLPINRTRFSAALTSSHEITLAGLDPTRTYYYQVVSRDAAGNSSVDNNQTNYYTFTTLTPLVPPITDAFETGATNWSVYSEDYTESEWTLGVPNNGVETAAHSPTHAWGTILNGGKPSLIDTFLVSPGVHLTGGNQVTLRFWHSYEFTVPDAFDIISGGEVLLIDNDNNEAIPLAVYYDNNSGWQQETIDLTPYLGKVVYLVWHHQLFSFDYASRGGWLVDDVEISVDTINAGTITISNNLSQASFVLNGPITRSGVGDWLVISNAPAGEYSVSFDPVPYQITPPPQTNTLTEGGLLLFSGIYSYPDANTNGISDEWEAALLGGVFPVHPGAMDTDSDGATDFSEFVAGTNPTNSQSKLDASLSLQPNELIRLQWPSTPGRTYLLESSTNMINWTIVSPWTRAAGSTMAQLLSRPTDSTMYRVQVRP